MTKAAGGRTSVLLYLNPWKYRRERRAEQVAILRGRDGDLCARCRRPMRFDLPAGHDLGARIETVRREANEALAGAYLTHGRCHVPGRDDTEAVMERLRPAREAELFAKRRSSRAA